MAHLMTHLHQVRTPNGIYVRAVFISFTQTNQPSFLFNFFLVPFFKIGLNIFFSWGKHYMTHNYTRQLVPNLKATVHQREFFLRFFFLIIWSSRSNTREIPFWLKYNNYWNFFITQVEILEILAKFQRWAATLKLLIATKLSFSQLSKFKLIFLTLVLFDSLLKKIILQMQVSITPVLEMYMCNMNKFNKENFLKFGNKAPEITKIQGTK